MTSNHELFSKLTPENISQFSKQLNASFLFDLIAFIEKSPPKMKFLIFKNLREEKAVSVFEYLSFGIQKEILGKLPSERVASLLNALSPDDRTALLEELPPHLMHLLLKYLSPEERALSIRLLGYPENSVGRLMTPDYLAIRVDWTVKEVLDYIRRYGHESETVNVIYAVDEKGKLVDDFRIKQFLFASLDTKAEDLADHKFISLNVNDNEENAINLFRKYARIALPVVDAEGLMLGIVTIDDIMNASVAKDTEDIQKIGGTLAFKETYLQIPILKLMRKRSGWLVVLFLGELLTASAMGFFQDELSKAVVLALFLPLIISSGGNAGSQASALLIRALALEEVQLRDWWRVVRREIFSGVFLGCVLGTIGFFRIIIWSLVFSMYGMHWLLVAFTVCFALIGVVLWGTLAGATLPLLLKWCGFDPAVSSAPFVATLVDVTGIIIYFSVAMLILRGTLL